MWNNSLYDTTMLTVELREIVEKGVDIWAFDYPSYYKGEEKKLFEQKVIDHYFFRQIGSETVGRFLHQFRTRVREIMPRYVDMYKTVELMHGLDNPFDNVDIVETFEQETTGTTSGSNSATETATSSGSSSASGSASETASASGSSSASGSTSESTTNEATKENSENKVHKFSNTPQGSISNLDHYMSEAAQDDNTTTETVNNTGTSSSNNSNSSESESESTSATTNTSQLENESESATSVENTSESASSGTITHTLTRKGNQGVNTYAHDIIEFRQSIIDVDMMIINDLNCLFLGVY